MTDGVVGLRDVTDGLGLLLSTQSFAARALIGSLVAAALAAAAVRLGWLKSRRARRGLVLAPIATAVAAAVASAGDAFLPPLVVATTGAGESWEFFGQEYRVLQLEWLLIAYVAVASFLLLRRGLSHLAIRMYVRGAVPCDDPAVIASVRRIASKLGLTSPSLLLIPDCPGGAFTTGLRHPVVCVDPDLVEQLDTRELEGLLAHELAHIARRDVPLNVAIGVIRDLTFFVPPLHLAARWLRQEQEHAADDLASDSTGRPAALASSILKVWEGASRRGVTVVASMACATMVPAPLPVPAGMPARILRQGGLRGGAKQIAARVVRLIEGEARATRTRERIELLALAVVLTALTAVTVVLPAQLADSSLLLGQWSRPVARPVESPALQTFRTLTITETTAFGTSVARPARAATCVDCLTVESTADWRRGVAPAAPVRTAGWAHGGYVWEDGSPVLVTAPRAEPLWGVDARTTRVGVFVVR